MMQKQILLRVLYVLQLKLPKDKCKHKNNVNNISIFQKQ